MCNNMFDCMENESLELEDSFNYEYTIKTSQEIIRERDITEGDIFLGYELSDENDGQSTENYSQCKKNKQCFICETDYLLVRTRESDANPIICTQNNIVDLANYYKNESDKTYYKCLDNCLSCTTGNNCNNCDVRYKLNEDQRIVKILIQIMNIVKNVMNIITY